MKLPQGTWLNPPLDIVERADGLLITAREKSDFWLTTSYGFVHDSGHVLLDDLPNESAIETSWVLDYHEEFDQAGLMIWADYRNWIKAGIEFADGKPQLGAVVTRGLSDWSVAPVEDWMNQEVALRFSRSDDALTIRARCGGAWQLVRLAPIEPKLNWRGGIFLASPSRAGLTVCFKSFQKTEADSSLH